MADIRARTYLRHVHATSIHVRLTARQDHGAHGHRARRHAASGFLTESGTSGNRQRVANLAHIQLNNGCATYFVALLIAVCGIGAVGRYAADRAEQVFVGALVLSARAAVVAKSARIRVKMARAMLITAPSTVR